MSAVDRWHHDGWLRPVDHALADTLRRLRPDTDPRVLLAAALCSRALAFGHSGLPLAQVHELCAEIDDTRTPPEWPDAPDWQAALRASPWVHDAARETVPDEPPPLVLDAGMLYLRRYHTHETRVAAALRQRAATPLPAADPATEAWREQRRRELFPGAGDEAQGAAALALLAQRVLLLTGGPGTGKTTTVAGALVLAVEDALRASLPPPRIALAAPTGKAATRLAESLRDTLARLAARAGLDAATLAALPGDARTLHRLLDWRPGTGPRDDGGPALALDLLVVDEASMVDLPMMARLLAALPAQARLLLVGDSDQLPSVDTGDVLAALCASPLPQVRLQQVHRQSAGHGIGALAAAVRAGDGDAVVTRLAADAVAGVQACRGSDRELPAAVLAAARPALMAIAAAATPAEALARARDFRVLTALRDGASGSVALNALLAADRHPGGGLLFAGALLMVTANSPRHGLFNGDVGVVHADASGELRVWFEVADGQRAWLPSALPAHEPAFALTVHKSQGSEFGQVFLALPEHPARVLSRELLYTGLTRCRTGLTLWARDDVLRTAIARPATRWSRLATRLSHDNPTTGVRAL